jgi:hypothetical protein
MNKTKKIAALVLMFSLLLNIIGASVYFHFCSGQLRSMAIGHPAPSCHQQITENQPSCHLIHENQEQSDCCKDTKVETSDLDDLFKDVSSSILFSGLFVLPIEQDIDLLISPLFVERNISIKSKSLTFKVQRDYCALLQTFLC